MVFITFEGIDGSGKTTQVRLLAEALTRGRFSVEATREPGGTPLGDAIRRIFLDPKNRGMSIWAELFLVEAARIEHVSKVIRPALEAGKVVLCDRFTDSTLVYQGYAREADGGKGLDIVEVTFLNQLATAGLTPDATILLDLEVEEGLRRVQTHEGTSENPQAPTRVGAVESRFEMEPREFHERVREGYLRLAEKEKDRIKVVDASGDPRSVHLRVIEGLKDSRASGLVVHLRGAPCR
jgi:dTMP kinase